MKTLLFLIAGIGLLLAANTVNSQIQSTPSGGLWNASGTWIGGIAPTAGDDVLIKGPVQVTFGASCNNIDVEAAGSLFSYSSASWTLTVHGNITNWGSITDNVPANTRLYIYAHNNIENHGLWKNFGIYAYGTTDSYIGADQPFEIKQFHNNKPTGNFLALSSLTFNSTAINFNNKDLIFVYGYELHLQNAAELRDISLGDDTNLHGDGTTLIYNVDCNNIAFFGEHNIGQGCYFNNVYNYGTLQNYSSATAAASIYGQFDNHGEIRDNPGFGNLIIHFSGNLQNAGIWTNYQLIAEGTADQFIFGLEPFEVDFLDHNNSTGNINTIGDVAFRGTDLRFYGRNMVSGGGKLTLEGPGNAHEVNFLLGGHPIEADENYYFTYSTFDNANVEGTMNLGASCYFTSQLLNNGTIRNTDGDSYTAYIMCDVINNGIICDHPNTGTLTTELSGYSISNSGTWSNQLIKLLGEGEQAIFASAPFTSPYFQSLKPYGKINLFSNCEFSGTAIDMNNDTLVIAFSTILSLNNNTTVNEAMIHAYDYTTGISMDGTGYLANCTLGFPALYGTVQLAGNVSFAGGFINYGTLQNESTDNRFVTVDGNVINYGSITDHSGGGSLTLGITGDIEHHGSIWQNTQTRLTGSQNQYVYLISATGITSQVRLYSMMTAGSYLWKRDNAAISGSDPLFSGYNTGILTFLQPTGHLYNGDYYCETNNGDSRHIFILGSASVFSLDAHVFLQGPFSGTLMNASLNLNGLLPLSQPYNTSPWNYAGTEAVAAIPNADIVDWVLVELRDAPDAPSAGSSNIVAQQAAFLLKNGSVVGTDGSALPVFTYSPVNSLFVVIWHRNHLGVMSAYPASYSTGIYSYDFTYGMDRAYGGMQAHKQLAPGIWGMIAADGNSDGQVNNSDKNDVWAPQAGANGYLQGDFSMDGQVNNTDKNERWKPNTGLGGQVPQ